MENDIFKEQLLLDSEKKKVLMILCTTFKFKIHGNIASHVLTSTNSNETEVHGYCYHFSVLFVRCPEQWYAVLGRVFHWNKGNVSEHVQLGFKGYTLWIE